MRVREGGAVAGSEEHIEVLLTFGVYLKELDAPQGRLPRALRREVPTYEQLGTELGVPAPQLWRVGSPAYTKSLSLSFAYRIIREMRGQGFTMGVRDLVAWYLPPELSEQAGGDRSWQAHIKVKDPNRLAVTLKPYLDHLRAEEEQRPEAVRREVPTEAEVLAHEIRVSKRTVERLFADQVQLLSLDKLERIVNVLVRRGFPVQPEDVLLYPGDTIGE